MKVTRHKTRITASMAVRFPVVAQGPHHQKNRRPDRRACRPVTASLRTLAWHGAAWRGNLVAQSRLVYPEFPTISRNFPQFPGGWGCPGASVQALSAVLGGHHDESRWQQLRLLSVLVPLRPTPNETMPRKGTILYCVDKVFDKPAPAGSRCLRGECRAGWSGCASSSERKSYGPR